MGVFMADFAYRTENFLPDFPFFSGLPKEDIDDIMKSARIRQCKKNEHIYHEGDKADRFYIIRDGWIRIYRGNADGEESIADILTNGDIFGARSALPGKKINTFSAQAIEDSCIVEFSGATLRGKAETCPILMHRLVTHVLETMDKLQVENEHMFLMSTSQRVACLFLRLSSHMLGNGGTFTFPYDKALAAAHLGMKRETFSRSLLRLGELGVSVSGYEISIDNFKDLGQHCCQQCSLNNSCKGARIDASPAEKADKVNFTYSRNSHDS